MKPKRDGKKPSGNDGKIKFFICNKIQFQLNFPPAILNVYRLNIFFHFLSNAML